INFVETTPEGERSVRLPTVFVPHILQRDDRRLPLVTSVQTFPLVLPDGSLRCGPGLDRDVNAIFRVPAALQKLLPAPNTCTAVAVVEALRFLTDEWLADVATDFTGKCSIVALILSVIERLLFPERPGFIVSANQRGSGKTTLLHMVSSAIFG